MIARKHSKSAKINQRIRVKRKFNARNKSSEKSSVIVFRSNKNIYASFVSPEGKFMFTASSKNSGNVTKAKGVGVDLAKWINKHHPDVKSLIFNRNGYRYHGRVKAVADGIRETNIEI